MNTPDLPKTMLFLLADKSSLRAAEGYLIKRGWSLKVTSNLKEAILHLIQNSPSYFYISVEFPNRRVLALAGPLAAYTNIIFLAEKSSRQVMSMVQAAPGKYKLLPPLNGPSVERITNRILFDRQNAGTSTNSLRRAGEAGADQDTVIKIRSSQDGEDSTLLQQSSLLTQLMGMMGEGADVGTSYQAGSSGPLAEGFATSAGALNHPSSQDPLLSAGDQVFEKAAEAHYNKPPGESATTSEVESFSARDFAEALENKKNSPWTGLQEAGLEGNEREWANEAKSGFSRLKSAALQRRKPKRAPIVYGKEHKDPAEVGSSSERPGPGKALGSLTVLTGEALDKESLMAKGSDLALRSSVAVKEATRNSGGLKTSRLACITVESDRINGYLLLAFAEDRALDPALIRNIREKLFAYLQVNGEKIHSSDELDLKLQEVAFQDWAMEHAEFLKKSYHEGAEVAMAFVPAEKKFSAPEENFHLKKYSLSLDEIRENTILEFDLFIHLPTNDKLIRYTPKGAKFYPEQKKRMAESGMKKMYIQKESLVDLRKYRLQNFLNDKIESFRRDPPAEV